MPGSVSQLSPVAAPRNRTLPNLEGAIGKMRFNEVKNVPCSVRCQLPYTKGDHERTSHADAKGVAVKVMMDGLKGASNSDAAALNRTISLLGPQRADKVGHILEMNLTALGATRASVALLQQEAGFSPRLDRLLAKLDVSILQIGIAAGNCKGVPEAVITDKKSERLSDAVEVGKDLMVQCVNELGGQQLLSGIARSVLPGAMMDSIAARLPHLVERFVNAEGAPDLMQALQTEAATKLDGVLRRQMETGGADAITSAILNLLKAPEYVKQGDPGRAGSTPDVPVRTNNPQSPAELLRGGPGTPLLYNSNHAPVTIKNDGSHTFSPTDIRNLVDESFDRGYALGLSHGEIKELRADNAALRKQNTDLMELLRKVNERLNLFAKGPDLVRVSGASSEDEVDIAVQQRNTAPPSGDDNPYAKLDPDSPRVPLVPDQARQQVLLDQTSLDHNSYKQRSDQHLNTGGNGGGGAITPPHKGDADSRTRLGGTQQLDQRQRTEQNLHQQRNEGPNRTSGTAGAGGGIDYLELRHYLQAAGFEERTLPADPYEPSSPRNAEPNAVRASDVKQYVKERNENAGTPFVPLMTGKQRPAETAPPGRFNELIQAFGRENIFPSLVAGAENTQRRSGSAPAPSPEKTDLQKGMEAFFRNNQSKSLEHPQRDPVPDSARSAHIPALSLSSRASSGRDLSFFGEEALDFGERIVAEPKDSQGTLSPRVGHLGQVARSFPSAPVIESGLRARVVSPFAAFRQTILDGAQKPRGGDERNEAFSEPHDPLATINVDEILELIRLEDQEQGDTTPATLQPDPLGLFNWEVRSDWSHVSTATSSSASSVVGDEFEDFGEFEPDRDDMLLKRRYSAFSMDSGRDSPSAQREVAAWEPQPIDRVAGQVTVDPTPSDIKEQQAKLIEQLGEHLRKRAS